MKKVFTREEILQGSGCYKETIGKSESIIGSAENWTIQEILKLDFNLKDKFWFVKNNCHLTTHQLRSLAIGCATVVLPIFEEKYPNNKAPREAIEAAQNYLNGTINLEELQVKRRAAYAAAAAAYAAYAADAADAAAAAAAAYAADAADAAAANAAAYAKDYKAELLNFLNEFVSKED